MQHNSRIGNLTFHPEEEAWVATIDTEAFKSFRFCWDRENQSYSSIDIYFRNHSEDAPPDSSWIDFTANLIKNAELLSPKLGFAAWEYFQSKHGDEFQDVVQFAYKPRPAPAVSSANDIGLLIGCPDLAIDEVDGTMFGRFSFSCGWDIEHGLGICTDGNQVTGIGDGLDAEPGDNFE